ncbi:MAG: ABC transporter permease subunit [Clostridia bacterium]|nr:ABC transporter permease subunit [Clostridia bacterium]
MFAIYKREMRSYFISPIGYIYLAIFLAVSGLIFSLTTLLQGAGSNISNYFTYMLISFFIVLPLLTMKLFADEKKQRTETLLISAPVSTTSMVTAKFFAAFSVFMIGFAVSLINLIPFFAYASGNPDWQTILGSLLGLILIAAAFIAIGVMVSSLTENQLVAALGTMGIIFVFVMISFFNGSIDSYFLRSILSWISVMDRYTMLTVGRFDVSAIVYFISLCFSFLFITVRVYEKRRWS